MRERTSQQAEAIWARLRLVRPGPRPLVIDAKDPGALDRLFRHVMHDEVEFHEYYFPERTRHIGGAAVRRYFEAFAESFDTFEVVIEEIEDAAAGAVVQVRYRAGTHIGASVDMRMCWVVRVEDGLLRRIDPRADRAEARALADSSAVA